MRSLALFFALVIAPCLHAQQACTRPICNVSPDSLQLSSLIDFNDVTSSIGIGSRIDEVLKRDGAAFGERFIGQTRHAHGDHDVISGAPILPLTLRDGGRGQTLGAMHLKGSIVLHGHGHRVYPKVEAVGEGSVAVLFDRDQPALSFDLRGGEQGFASVIFIRRDGSTIDTHTLGPLGEDSFGFERKSGQPDIAGFILLNTDPQGIALDNLRFDGFDLLG
ncbi:hypothetical protein [Planktotalea sp.]|uniref:hypothetical protein n=1 Tax=Planktotalea sp. TaxID=2029877 RepID=UPI003299D5CA